MTHRDIAATMSRPPLLSPAQIEQLLAQQPITELHPWSTGDDQAVEAFLKWVWATVERLTRCRSKVEWGHYGSGYASFVDAWCYQATPEFNVKRPIGQGEEHTGLVVLFSRLSPYFVFMEGEKRWHAKGGSSYLPEFNMLDRLETPAVARLAQQVQPVLESHGLVRALRAQLEEPLGTGVQVPTNLTDRGYTQFDALFHWED